MKRPKTAAGLTRRDTLKLSGLALGGLAMGGVEKAQAQCTSTGGCYPNVIPKEQYKYFDDLDEFHPVGPLGRQTPLDTDEMRISFMGSGIPPNLRRIQQMMSIFVEVGWDEANQKPLDQFVFDCGSGVCTNYNAMGVGLGRMDKVFLCHLHGDHMSDLTHIYCFGPSTDRKTPLYVWGPGPSGVKSPRPPRRLYDDGTHAFCRNLRDATRWHTESFSFQPTSYLDPHLPTRESWGLPCDPIPVGDDDPYDGYALVPIELEWRNVGGVAYNNQATGVKIIHFPVVHCRKGSIGYKLEWKSPSGKVFSMIFTSDTRPETISINQAINKDDRGVARGVDVFIHEMIVPPEVWLMKIMGLPAPPQPGNPIYESWLVGLEDAKRVQESSHTPQGAFGYLLKQITPRPRLTVATHFPVADDTVACAYQSVLNHVPDIVQNPDLVPDKTNITWSRDLMVIRVWEHRIQQLKAVVSDFEYSALPRPSGESGEPKYALPTDQIDTTNVILPGDTTYCESGY